MVGFIPTNMTGYNPVGKQGKVGKLTVNADDIRQLASDVLQGTLICSRDWSAWQYKTMTDDDFVNSEDDEDFLDQARGLIEDYLVNLGAEIINK